MRQAMSQALGMLCAAILLAACQPVQRPGASAPSTGQAITIEYSEGGITAPATVQGGLVAVDFLDSRSQALPGEPQIVRLADGKTAEDYVLTFVPIAGFGLLIVANVLQLGGVFTAANNSAAGIAWIALLAGMMLVGILTIAARQWQGWQRFVPLLTVIAVPLGFGLGAAIGGLTLGTALLYVTWILLGYAVFTGGRTAVLRPAQA